MFELPSVVAIAAAVIQRGCGVEMSRGRNDSGVDNRPKSRCGHGSDALARFEQMAVEPSMPLAQNVFAMHRPHASTTVIQAPEPQGFGATELWPPTATGKIGSEWKNGEL